MTELCENGQVDNDGRGKERVLASVVHDNRVATTKHQLANVLVEGSLRIAHIGHILDDDSVVRVGLTLSVQHLVRVDHVIDDVGLANFLAAELLRSRQIVAVIVAQVVVADNGAWFDASTDQKVNQHRLELGLTGLEIITGNENVFAFSQLEKTGNKSILRRTVDVGSL